jgi:hypothetical protein
LVSFCLSLVSQRLTKLKTGVEYPNLTSFNCSLLCTNYSMEK